MRCPLLPEGAPGALKGQSGHISTGGQDAKPKVNPVSLDLHNLKSQHDDKTLDRGLKVPAELP